MGNWVVGVRHKLTKKLETLTNHVYFSDFYKGHIGGNVRNQLEITFFTDKAMSFNDMNGSAFVVLYPEQVEHLKQVLKERDEFFQNRKEEEVV
jgi:hypothetical protein